MRRAIVIVAIVACASSEHRAAREKYNDGVDLLAKGDFAGAETALLDARNQAGVDPELRFRAAYDLGLAYAAHADKTKAGEDADLSKALELEQQAVTWFFDASQLRKDDADTKQNLATVRARVRAIEDQLARGEGKLEARLDALVGEQRGVLDEARGAWAAIKQAHGADPLAQRDALVHLADKERGLLAEAGVIGDLASDEIDAIGKKPEDKRSDQEKVRVVQLKNLDIYLMDGRTRITEARAKLQELAAEDGVGRAETALVALKRAREQLLDPITVMRELGRDELELAQQTAADFQAGPMATIPGWLAPKAQAERQGGLRDRLEEVRARLAAGLTSPADGNTKPEQQKLLERVAAAMPHVEAASAAMDAARGKLDGGKLEDAGESQKTALVELGKAIEQFADLKQLIDLAAETQHQVVDQLDNKDKQAVDGLAQNVARVARLKDLIADEAAKKPDDKVSKEQIEQMKQQLAAAESLRSDAEKALAATDAAIRANKDPQTSAKLAADKLDELRRLFFNLIEHLQDLIRQQGDTKDQTSQADADDDFTRAPKLPGLVQQQAEHGQLAKAITDALAKQADEAAKQKDQQQGPVGPKQLSAAADEVRLAQNDMTDAGVTLGKAKDAKQSVSLKPAVDSQGKAIEHLQNALKLLQPPQKNKDQKQQDQQQQQQQEQQQQQQQQQQGGAGQRARDEDAKRQRQRQQQGGDEPVDKDW